MRRLRVPPYWVRRSIVTPVLLVAFVVTLAFALALAPLLAVVAVGWGLFTTGRQRPLRILAVLVTGLVLELVVLVALFALWIRSGFGAWIRRPDSERRHYDLVAWYLRVLYRVSTRVLRVAVEIEGPDPDAYLGRPLLVFSRHAGPGDSFLLVHALMNWYRREPRIVLGETLQWHPALDVLLHRIPARFVPGRGGRRGARIEAQIGRLASDLDSDDALVLFPEGGNFTQRRRQARITRLYEKGLVDLAERSRQMRHVLAPRTGGVTAALLAAPEADVVWVAHAGLDDLYTVADFWRALPMHRTLRMRWWRVPAGEVPKDPDAHVEWLYDWWRRIDDWIDDDRTRQASRR